MSTNSELLQTKLLPFAPLPALLDVIVIEAGNLPQLSSGTNAFCVLSIENHDYVTGIIPQSANPFWKEDCTFMIWHPTSELSVEVFSRGLLFDQPLGSVKVRLVELEDQEVHDIWFPIRSKEDSTPTGVLHLRLQYVYNSNKRNETMLTHLGVPVRTMSWRVKTGDIVLFDSNHLLPFVTKIVTLSQWDHVAMVVIGPAPDYKPYLFEVTHPEGVRLYNFDERVKGYRQRCRIGIRRLYGSDRGIVEPLQLIYLNYPLVRLQNALKEGELFKQGKAAKSWRRRWFLLTPTMLHYFRTIQANGPVGSILLDGSCMVKEADKSIGKPNCISFLTPQRIFYLAADTEWVMLEWMIALENVIRAQRNHSRNSVRLTHGDLSVPLAVPSATDSSTNFINSPRTDAAQSDCNTPTINDSTTSSSIIFGVEKLDNNASTEMRDQANGFHEIEEPARLVVTVDPTPEINSEANVKPKTNCVAFEGQSDMINDFEVVEIEPEVWEEPPLEKSDLPQVPKTNVPNSPTVCHIIEEKPLQGPACFKSTVLSLDDVLNSPRKTQVIAEKPSSPAPTLNLGLRSHLEEQEQEDQKCKVRARQHSWSQISKPTSLSSCDVVDHQSSESSESSGSPESFESRTIQATKRPQSSRIQADFANMTVSRPHPYPRSKSQPHLKQTNSTHPYDILPFNVSMLNDFILSVKGRPYDLSLIEILRSTLDSPQPNPTNNGTYPSTNENEVPSRQNGLFCSELIAATYKHMGLLQNNIPSKCYTPRSFSEELSLAQGACLSEVKIFPRLG